MNTDNPNIVPTDDLYFDYHTYHYCWFPTRTMTATPSASTKKHWVWLRWVIRIETLMGKIVYEEIR